MMKPEINVDYYLKLIADILLESGMQVKDFGLVNGKMGISVFLFHYARYSGNLMYKDYAVALIEEIQQQTYDSNHYNYAHGLAGVGIGIDYLAQNDFITVGKDILDDFDDKLRYVTFSDCFGDFSLYTGLTGYGRYWQSRVGRTDTDVLMNQILDAISKKITKLDEKDQFDVFCFLFDLNHLSLYSQRTRWMLHSCKQYCNHIANCIPEMSFPRLGYTISGKMIRKYLLNKYLNIDWYSFKMVMNEEITNLEIQEGLSTYGLCLLNSVSPRDISWIGLF